MQTLRLFARSSAFILLMSSQVSFAQTEEIRRLIEWETKSNAVAVRSNDLIALEHYEIPYDIVGKFLSPNLPDSIRDALIIQKNGQTYVRWIINPDDTKWHLKMEEWMKKNNVPLTKHKHFKAWHTASRSMIVYDPTTNAQFSAKVSTNQAGGLWSDKPQQAASAFEARVASEFVSEFERMGKFTHTVILEDVASFANPGVDQAMLIRELGEAAEGKKFYLPAFSALHETTGREIALLNGSIDPASFWNEHLNKPVARSIAEVAAYTGLTFDSPHAQNFLIELDANKRPTGRIAMRDFGDTYLYKRHFYSMDLVAGIRMWPLQAVKEQLKVNIGLLYGNTAPSWLSGPQYDQWGTVFFEAFESEYSRITGVPQSNLAQTAVKLETFGYHGKDYSQKQLEGEAMKIFHGALGAEIRASGTYNYFKNILFGRSCAMLGHSGGFY